MNDGDALLRAIIDHPDDDTPRLIYADWLDDQGDPGKAEFIRVQVGLEGMSAKNPEYRKLKKREIELLDEHKAEWDAPFKELGIDATHYKRGFVEGIEVKEKALRKNAGAIFDLAPIRSLNVELNAAIDISASILNLDQLERCHTLIFKDNYALLGSELAALRDCPRAKNLKSLSFAANIEDEDMRAFIQSPLARQLTSLEVTSSLSLNCLGSLLNADLPALRRLSLDISREGVLDIMQESPFLRQLDALRLRHMPVGSNEQMGEFIEHADLSRLSSFSIERDGEFPLAFQYVADGIAGKEWKNLKELRINGLLNGGGLRVISEAESLNALESFTCDGIRNKEDLRIFAEGPLLGRLSKLSFMNEYREQDGVPSAFFHEEIYSPRRKNSHSNTKAIAKECVDSLVQDDALKDKMANLTALEVHGHRDFNSPSDYASIQHEINKQLLDPRELGVHTGKVESNRGGRGAER